MLSGFELNQLLMPAKSGAVVAWLAAATLTGAARRSLVADAGDDGAGHGEADQRGGDGEQFESHGHVLR